MGRNLSGDEMMTAILSYLGILVLIPLFLVKKRNGFIEFHLKQGIGLLIVEVALWFAGMALFFLWPLNMVFGFLNMIVFIISLVALVKAVMGEKWEIPYLWEHAKNIKLPKA